MDWRLVPVESRELSAPEPSPLRSKLCSNGLFWPGGQNHWQCYTRCQKRLPVWWGSKNSCNKLNPTNRIDRMSRVQTVRPKFFFKAFQLICWLEISTKTCFSCCDGVRFLPNLYHFDFIISPSYRSHDVHDLHDLHDIRVSLPNVLNAAPPLGPAHPAPLAGANPGRTAGRSGLAPPLEL